jgi:hypothetical protein
MVMAGWKRQLEGGGGVAMRGCYGCNVLIVRKSWVAGTSPAMTRG